MLALFFDGSPPYETSVPMQPDPHPGTPHWLILSMLLISIHVFKPLLPWGHLEGRA